MVHTLAQYCPCTGKDVYYQIFLTTKHGLRLLSVFMTVLSSATLANPQLSHFRVVVQLFEACLRQHCVHASWFSVTTGSQLSIDSWRSCGYYKGEKGPSSSCYHRTVGQTFLNVCRLLEFVPYACHVCGTCNWQWSPAMGGEPGLWVLRCWLNE